MGTRQWGISKTPGREPSLGHSLTPEAGALLALMLRGRFSQSLEARVRTRGFTRSLQ